MLTQEEIILATMERLGGRITTFELMKLGLSQYQARLLSLREKLSKRGVTLTYGEPIIGQKGNHLYRIIREPKQLDLPMRAA